MKNMNDNTRLRIKVPKALYESIQKELSKKKLKESYQGTQYDSSEEMALSAAGVPSKGLNREGDQFEEGIADKIRAASDKLFYDILVDAPKGMSEEDRKINIKNCIDGANKEKKANPKVDRSDLIVNCLRKKGFPFGSEGSQPGMSAMGGSKIGARAWEGEQKKDMTLEDLKRAKSMIEAKIKSMEGNC